MKPQPKRVYQKTEEKMINDVNLMLATRTDRNKNKTEGELKIKRSEGEEKKIVKIYFKSKEKCFWL